ncbi:MAG: hypothetical protein WBD61_05465, partial [Desulfobulbales bacterium]
VYIFATKFNVHFACPKRTKRAAVHLARCSGLPSAAHKERATSESREVYTPLRGTPPSRLSVLCCAARRREMAAKTFSWMTMTCFILIWWNQTCGFLPPTEKLVLL